MFWNCVQSLLFTLVTRRTAQVWPHAWFRLMETADWMRHWVVSPTSPPPLLPFSTSTIEIVHWCKTCWAGVSVCLPSLPRGSTTLNIAPPPPSPSVSPSLPRSFPNWEPLVHTGDPERPVSPWAGRPRGSGSPCADSGSVNRADGFWQIHSDWKSFILQDFFLLSPLSWNPPCTKRAVHLPSD